MAMNLLAAEKTYLYLLLVILQVVDNDGHVFLDPELDVRANCGEVAKITCNATDTNAVTITAHNESDILGAHTYERGSSRVAKAGTLDLYLVQAAVSGKNPYLTNFLVNASGTFTGETTYVTCVDTYDSKNVSIKARKIDCQWTVDTVDQRDLGNGSTLLQWEKPSCVGWGELSHYTVSITDVGEKVIVYTAKDPALRVADEVIKIVINATNICQETISLEQLNDNGDDYQDVVTGKGTGPAGGLLLPLLATLFGFCNNYLTMV